MVVIRMVVMVIGSYLDPLWVVVLLCVSFGGNVSIKAIKAIKAKEAIMVSVKDVS